MTAEGLHTVNSRSVSALHVNSGLHCGKPDYPHILLLMFLKKHPIVFDAIVRIHNGIKFAGEAMA